MESSNRKWAEARFDGCNCICHNWADKITDCPLHNTPVKSLACDGSFFEINLPKGASLIRVEVV